MSISQRTASKQGTGWDVLCFMLGQPDYRVGISKLEPRASYPNCAERPVHMAVLRFFQLPLTQLVMLSFGSPSYRATSAAVFLVFGKDLPRAMSWGRSIQVRRGSYSARFAINSPLTMSVAGALFPDDIQATFAKLTNE